MVDIDDAIDDYGANARRGGRAGMDMDMEPQRARAGGYDGGAAMAAARGAQHAASAAAAKRMRAQAGGVANSALMNRGVRMDDGDLGGDGEGLGEEGEDNSVYCTCRRVAFGEMIGCDNNNCPIEWFHMECVGLTQASRPKGKWFCPQCRKASQADEEPSMPMPQMARPGLPMRPASAAAATARPLLPPGYAPRPPAMMLKRPMLPQPAQAGLKKPTAPMRAGAMQPPGMTPMMYRPPTFAHPGMPPRGAMPPGPPHHHHPGMPPQAQPWAHMPPGAMRGPVMAPVPPARRR
jgi:hypothetical protein